MKLRLIWCALLFLATNLVCLAGVGETERIAQIDAWLTEGVKKGFSGSVLVARNERILLEKGYGMNLALPCFNSQ